MSRRWSSQYRRLRLPLSRCRRNPLPRRRTDRPRKQLMMSHCAQCVTYGCWAARSVPALIGENRRFGEWRCDAGCILGPATTLIWTRLRWCGAIWPIRMILNEDVEASVEGGQIGFGQPRAIWVHQLNGGFWIWSCRGRCARSRGNTPAASIG